MPPKPNMVRLQFEVSSEDAAALKELMQETGAVSFADLMRRSLSWYQDTFRHWEKGYECVFRREPSNTERYVALGALFPRLGRPEEPTNGE